MRQRNDRSENYCAVVQAIQGTHGALNRNLLLVDSYPEVVNGRIPVRLLNVGHESILLNPRDSSRNFTECKSCICKCNIGIYRH